MTNDITSLSSDLIARFDAFLSDFMPDRDTASELIDDANADRNAAILSLIDSQFDDEFAIITEIDANAESLFIEFIEPNRLAFTAFMTARFIDLLS